MGAFGCAGGSVPTVGAAVTTPASGAPGRPVPVVPGAPALFATIDEPREAPAHLAPLVVLVHGSLDRSASFRRLARRLPEVRTLTYDRRGYQGSRHAGEVCGLNGHVDDLLGLVAAVRRARGGSPVVVFGHSFGADVALAAAAACPGTFGAVAAYEPPLPWLGLRRGPRRDPGATPEERAERFFRAMVSDGAWERLRPADQDDRRADGPALAAELDSIRHTPAFDPAQVTVPVVLGHGGPASALHHRQGVARLATLLPSAEVVELPGAGHGAHLSHPDHLAALVRRAVEVASAGTNGVA